MSFVRSVAFSPDGSRFASAEEEGIIRFWDLAGATGNPLTAHAGAVDSVAFSPDGSRLASAGRDGTICLWDPATGRPIGNPLTAHTGAVASVAFSPDGIRLASAGEDKTIRLWDLATGRPIGNPLTGHTSWVGSVAFSPDGTRLASASHDGTVRLWNPVTGQEVGCGPAAASSRSERRNLHAELTSDLDTDHDALGFAGDVQSIAAVLAARNFAPPLSIALLGDWGTGKSSFMRQLQSRVRVLAQSARERPSSVFVASVRQVRFNAWHYSDDHLWVGLIEHLFRELHHTDSPRQYADDGDSSSRKAELNARLSRLKADHKQLTKDLDAVSDHERPGVLSAVGTPAGTLRIARAAGRSALVEAREAGWLVWITYALFIIGVGAVAVALTLGWSLPTVLTSGAIATAGGIGIAAAKKVAKTQSDTASLSERAHKRLLERKADLEKRIEKDGAELDRIDPKRRIDRLLTEISSPDRYATYRGLVGRIHSDLSQLSKDIATALADTGSPESADKPPLERIVLYIDDLDRCTPQRVVDVLQAVNLLVSLDLFMVVVAVDPRWLLRALTIHHSEMFATPDGLPTAPDRNVGPLDYLDKIFHVPFALRPMGSAAELYLLGLLPAAEQDRPRPTSRPTPQQDSAATEAPATEPTALPEVSADTEPTEQQESEAPHTPAPAGPATPAPVLDEPDSLLLRQSELDFLARLVPLMSSPRAIKKLANLYRLLRLSVHHDDLDDWLGDDNGGPYQAAAVLLAALVGAPGQARTLLIAISSATAADIVDALRTVDNTPNTKRIADLIAEIDKDMPVLRDTATYQAWAGAVARFGFETYDLFQVNAG